MAGVQPRTRQTTARGRLTESIGAIDHALTVSVTSGASSPVLKISSCSPPYTTRVPLAVVRPRAASAVIEKATSVPGRRQQNAEGVTAHTHAHKQTGCQCTRKRDTRARAQSQHKPRAHALSYALTRPLGQRSRGFARAGPVRFQPRQGQGTARPEWRGSFCGRAIENGTVATTPLDPCACETSAQRRNRRRTGPGARSLTRVKSTRLRRGTGCSAEARARTASPARWYTSST